MGSYDRYNVPMVSYGIILGMSQNRPRSAVLRASWQICLSTRPRGFNSCETTLEVSSWENSIHRIGLWEKLQESPIFDGQNHGFL